MLHPENPLGEIIKVQDQVTIQDIEFLPPKLVFIPHFLQFWYRLRPYNLPHILKLVVDKSKLLVKMWL